jgi:adenosylhomocysteine nucleosidase
MSAYEPEWKSLQVALRDREDRIVDGTTFTTGQIEGRPVVLFLTGLSMVNAAMTTQLVIDQFNVDGIVFSGIAGGVDPNLDIGDVVVPAAWSEYLEAVFARRADRGYKLPNFIKHPKHNNFGMIFPQPVQISSRPDDPEERIWFPVDAHLLEIAGRVGKTVQLSECTADGNCLRHHPKVVIGGNGVSGQAFVDNKAFREYVRKTFYAEAVDMETAAVAHVAYKDKIAFIAFRALSDLAGGGGRPNEIETFKQLASDNSAAVVKAFLKALR